MVKKLNNLKRMTNSINIIYHTVCLRYDKKYNDKNKMSVDFAYIRDISLYKNPKKMLFIKSKNVKFLYIDNYIIKY